MPDIYLPWGGDMLVDQSGNVVLAENWDEVSQKLERDLLTTPAIQQTDGTLSVADCVFHPDYGAGLRQFLGQLTIAGIIQQIQTKTLSQIRQNPNIATSPAPVVAFQVITPFILRVFIDVSLKNQQPSILPNSLVMEISP